MVQESSYLSCMHSNNNNNNSPLHLCCPSARDAICRLHMSPLQTRCFGQQCSSWRHRNNSAAAAVADSAPGQFNLILAGAADSSPATVKHAADPAPLACFLASHVSDMERATALNRVLESISVASDGGPSFLAVSWSSDGDSAIQSAVRKSLSDAAARGLTVRAHEQRTKTSQFEHYRRLAESCASAPPVWVMFSDDDDVWSERRHEIYAREAALAAPTVTTLLCRRKTAMLAAATHDDEPRDAAGVRRLLSRRLARFTDCNLKDGLDESEHNMVRPHITQPFARSVRRPNCLRLAPCLAPHRSPSTSTWPCAIRCLRPFLRACLLASPSTGCATSPSASSSTRSRTTRRCFSRLLAPSHAFSRLLTLSHPL